MSINWIFVNDFLEGVVSKALMILNNKDVASVEVIEEFENWWFLIVGGWDEIKSQIEKEKKKKSDKEWNWIITNNQYKR